MVTSIDHVPLAYFAFRDAKLFLFFQTGDGFPLTSPPTALAAVTSPLIREDDDAVLALLLLFFHRRGEEFFIASIVVFLIERVLWCRTGPAHHLLPTEHVRRL